MNNYYQILRLTPSASREEIKRAYRVLCLRYHPDRNGGDKYYEERLKEINEAYDTLGDADKRANYDDYLQRGEFGNGYSEREKEEYSPSAAPPPDKGYSFWRFFAWLAIVGVFTQLRSSIGSTNSPPLNYQVRFVNNAVPMNPKAQDKISKPLTLQPGDSVPYLRTATHANY